MFKIVTAFIMKYTGWLKYDRLKGRSDFARCCIIMNGLEMIRNVSGDNGNDDNGKDDDENNDDDGDDNYDDDDDNGDGKVM